MRGTSFMPFAISSSSVISTPLLFHQVVSSGIPALVSLSKVQVLLVVEMATSFFLFVRNDLDTPNNEIVLFANRCKNF